VYWPYPEQLTPSNADIKWEKIQIFENEFAKLSQFSKLWTTRVVKF